jgi:hypothetical protein
VFRRCRMHHPDWHTLRKVSSLPLSAKRIQQMRLQPETRFQLRFNYFVIAAKIEMLKRVSTYSLFSSDHRNQPLDFSLEAFRGGNCFIIMSILHFSRVGTSDTSHKASLQHCSAYPKCSPDMHRARNESNLS